MISDCSVRKLSETENAQNVGEEILLYEERVNQIEESKQTHTIDGNQMRVFGATKVSQLINLKSYKIRLLLCSLLNLFNSCSFGLPTHTQQQLKVISNGCH